MQAATPAPRVATTHGDPLVVTGKVSNLPRLEHLDAPVRWTPASPPLTPSRILKKEPTSSKHKTVLEPLSTAFGHGGISGPSPPQVRGYPPAEPRHHKRRLMPMTAEAKLTPSEDGCTLPPTKTGPAAAAAADDKCPSLFEHFDAKTRLPSSNGLSTSCTSPVDVQTAAADIFSKAEPRTALVPLRKPQFKSEG